MKELFKSLSILLIVFYIFFTLSQWTILRKGYWELYREDKSGFYTDDDYRYTLVEIFQMQKKWFRGFKIR